MAKQSGASARFEKRWKQAVEQPELVEAPPVKLDIDLSPSGVLARMRTLDRDALGYGAEALDDVLKGLRDRFR
jgi:hypothetical protein